MSWSMLKKIAGALFIVLGLLAFFTPLTPGSWLVFVGAELLGIEMLSKRRVTESFTKLRMWFTGKKEQGSEDEKQP